MAWWSHHKAHERGNCATSTFNGISKKDAYSLKKLNGTSDSVLLLPKWFQNFKEPEGCFPVLEDRVELDFKVQHCPRRAHGNVGTLS
ncbi:hypothetical protein T01_14504 [Trichinella spiralis]|uniref:Uncharacterized protein n=1 Tax=Trichinella spiralis TaxID=6334 RepID=A0A0V1C1N8_TRISP|nr:hypothetical protein T01_14504 [Trichinella spiralis]